MIQDKLRIVYANVGIDKWPTKISPDTTKSYDDIISGFESYGVSGNYGLSNFFMKDITKDYNKIQRSIHQQPVQDFFQHSNSSCISEQIGSKLRNICENGCIKLLPGIATVMDTHISNVKNIKADIYVLIEMCQNRMSMFQDQDTKPLIRIKKKDDIFTLNKDWEPKIDTIVSKIPIKRPCYFESRMNDGIPTFLDEQFPNGIIDENLIDRQLLSTLYNCNLTLMKDVDNNEILLYAVHWPTFKNETTADAIYKKEINHTFQNIKRYLTLHFNTTFLAIGDFNTNVPGNKKLFDMYAKSQINRYGSFQGVSNGNDGYIYYLSPNFKSIKMSYEKPSKPQPLSAHRIHIFDLIKNQPLYQLQSQSQPQSQLQPQSQNRPRLQLKPRSNLQQNSSIRFTSDPQLAARFRQDINEFINSIESDIPTTSKQNAVDFLFKYLSHSPEKLADPDLNLIAKSIGELYKKTNNDPYNEQIINKLYPQVLQKLYLAHTTTTMKGGESTSLQELYIKSKKDYLALNKINY